MITKLVNESSTINCQLIRTCLVFSFLVFCLLLPSASFGLDDFEGALKGVTITDSSGTNMPPTAVINYTQDGDTINFDATRLQIRMAASVSTDGISEMGLPEPGRL